MNLPIVDKLVTLRITWHTFHDVTLGLFVRERDCGHHVCAEIDAEDRDGSERQWNTGDDEEQERGDLGNVTGERVRDGLLQIVKNKTT